MASQTSMVPLRLIRLRATIPFITAQRAFVTSSSVRQTDKPPPESPAFIYVPTPPLSETEKLPRVRGHLPIPRNVFPPAEGDRKVTESYIQQTAPEPSNESSMIPARDGSAEEWRRKMAEKRRENLRQGLSGLWQRKKARDDEEGKAKIRKIKRDKKASEAQEPRSEEYTRSTVLKATAEDTAVLPDPLRMQRAEESRIRTSEMQAQHQNARRDHLVELYMKASKFIVHETQLQQEIDRIFSETYWPVQPGFYEDGNAWASWGNPSSVENMLNDYTNSGNTRQFTSSRAGSTHNAMRQKEVAQELIGGKIN
ncbi:hypothetical protein CFIMG_008481RA00001 [Ceratocystis fimbriata CBS 114723]|uniref:Uncharacterized protein n=1 Tax=Ceratocystis fimbriata CBS 114723 TaxID=1035309 RepID=A0A2C5X266_9PEZI|nr:hypothetical protein CFIMG_008481RA00001 [Ceratocystis fimbriata CBS 114723]